jgi:hypothetical protein
MEMGCGATGMGGSHRRPACWMAALGGLMAGQSGLPSSGASARFPAEIPPCRAMALSAHSSGFLIAGALQLDHWASLTSNFLEQFKWAIEFR